MDTGIPAGCPKILCNVRDGKGEMNKIFPLDTLRFFPRIMFNGVISAIRGE